MICLHPQSKTRLVKGNTVYYTHRCGQCMSCRIHKRKAWALRILLEATQWETNLFITLTIHPRHLKLDGVNKDDIRNFIKRLRHRIGWKVRYFAVGAMDRDWETI